jgi:hypothetical protein
MNDTLCFHNDFLPLGRDEMYETRGGFLGIIAAGLIIAAGAAIINDWDNFKAGLMGRPEIK